MVRFWKISHPGIAWTKLFRNFSDEVHGLQNCKKWKSILWQILFKLCLKDLPLMQLLYMRASIMWVGSHSIYFFDISIKRFVSSYLILKKMLILWLCFFSKKEIEKHSLHKGERKSYENIFYVNLLIG